MNLEYVPRVIVQRDPVEVALREYPQGSQARTAAFKFVALAEEAGLTPAKLLRRLQEREGD